MGAHIPKKRSVTAREGAKRMNMSVRTVQRYMAQPRDEWIAEQRARRHAILETYENNDDLTWEDVAYQFGIKPDTARQLARRARKEREAEERAKTEPPLPIPGLAA